MKIYLTILWTMLQKHEHVPQVPAREVPKPYQISKTIFRVPFQPQRLDGKRHPLSNLRDFGIEKKDRIFYAMYPQDKEFKVYETIIMDSPNETWRLERP